MVLSRSGDRDFNSRTPNNNLGSTHEFTIILKMFQWVVQSFTIINGIAHCRHICELPSSHLVTPDISLIVPEYLILNTLRFTLNELCRYERRTLNDETYVPCQCIIEKS